MAQRKGRVRHRLILLTLLAVTLLTADLRGFNTVNQAQSLLRDILHPVNSLASNIFEPVGDVWNSLFSYGDLEDENAALRAELAALRGTALRAEGDSAAYQDLLKALDLAYAPNIETVTARVERGPVGNFARDVVTINKGQRDGIEAGMAVVTNAGLVGRVQQVDGVTATVQLLSDPDLVVGVRLVSTNNVGLGHALAGGANLFVINQGPNWPTVDDVGEFPQVGSAVVTDADSRYTADVPIGRVIEVRPASDDLSLEVLVELANEIEDLSFVSILLTKQINEPTAPVLVPSTSVPLDINPNLITPDVITPATEAP